MRISHSCTAGGCAVHIGMSIALLWLAQSVASDEEIKPSQCTSRLPIALQHDGLDRTATLVKPPALCKPTAKATKGAQDVDVVRVPLLVALHCLGCDKEWGTRAFRKHMATLGWLLLVPHGESNSWNAGDCCGYARDHNLDDVGFVGRLISKVMKEHGVRHDAVFVVGWSNGGFLSSILASSTKIPFRGIAPIAGYDYVPSRLQTLGAAVFFQMTRKDQIVRFSGCCRATTCCCNIGSQRDVCMTSEAAAATFRGSNNCTGNVGSYVDDDVECWMGKGCDSSTFFCAWQHLSHGAIGNGHPLCLAVVFFASLVGQSEGIDKSWCLGSPPAVVSMLTSKVQFHDDRFFRKPDARTPDVRGPDAADAPTSDLRGASGSAGQAVQTLPTVVGAVLVVCIITCICLWHRRTHVKKFAQGSAPNTVVGAPLE